MYQFHDFKEEITTHRRVYFYLRAKHTVFFVRRKKIDPYTTTTWTFIVEFIHSLIVLKHVESKDVDRLERTYQNFVPYSTARKTLMKIFMNQVANDNHFNSFETLLFQTVRIRPTSDRPYGRLPPCPAH